MILNYILLLLSFLGLAIIGLNHYIQIDFFSMAPIKLNIFISLIYIAAETLVMFFFVGTGVSIKEYIQANPKTDHKYHKESIAIKRELYPPTMMATLLFVAMVIFDGGWLMRQISRWWFHGFYLATVYYFIKSLLIQHRCFKKNTLLILEMTKTKAKINSADLA
tara:strand:- start:366 stop:857 length:492 start_codon:yes stop_codon:yes gene_type:complete